MSGRKLLIAAVVVAIGQIGFLGTMIQSRAALLRGGQEVVLKTQPVDPRDLLRGDYVALSYDVSRVPISLLQSQHPFDNEAIGSVIVRLQLRDGLQPAEPVALFLRESPTAPPEGQVDLAGKSETRWSEGVKEIAITYGLERFYLPEGEGRAIEQGMRERTFKMAVAVGADGLAQIKRFYDDDQPIYEEPLY